MKNLIIITLLSIFFLTSNKVHAQAYDNAAGLRVAWGIGGTYKHFFNDKIAAEGILNYWSRGSLGFKYTWTRITALVEMHNDLSSVTEGLQWYVGGGAFAGFWGGEFSRLYEYDQTQIGLSGTIGLDYTFADLPINISVDWMPSLALAGGGGFFGNAGGIAVRYTF